MYIASNWQPLTIFQKLNRWYYRIFVVDKIMAYLHLQNDSGDDEKCWIALRTIFFWSLMMTTKGNKCKSEMCNRFHLVNWTQSFFVNV
jgi:hypothetical protein